MLVECGEQKVGLEASSGGCLQRQGGINTKVGMSAKRRLAMGKANWTDVKAFFSACVYF